LFTIGNIEKPSPSLDSLIRWIEEIMSEETSARQAALHAAWNDILQSLIERTTGIQDAFLSYLYDERDTSYE
jgi:hypothetical protein